MQKEALVRTTSERLVTATVASLARRPLPVAAHQAASDLYDAVDSYTAAVVANNQAQAQRAAERVAVEAMRTLVGYQLPQVPAGVMHTQVEAAKSRTTDSVEA